VHSQCEKALLNLALAFDDANRVSFVLLHAQSALPKRECGGGSSSLIVSYSMRVPIS
jgi:hypothetical protein